MGGKTTDLADDRGDEEKSASSALLYPSQRLDKHYAVEGWEKRNKDLTSNHQKNWPGVWLPVLCMCVFFFNVSVLSLGPPHGGQHLG